MKNKFLVLAMVTAILATFALPSVGFAATAGDSSSEIGVEADTTLTLVLNGVSASSTFALDPYIANDEDLLSWSMPTDAIVVTDYTGDASDKNGHMISVGLHSNTWWYSGSANGVDLAVVTSVTPGSDELTFGFWDNSTFYAGVTFADVADACTSSGVSSTVIAGTVLLTATESKLFHNSEVCPGTSYYPPELFVIGPSNGVYEGSYTISGTYVVYDDSDTVL